MRDLIERLEAATGRSEKLDAEIACALSGNPLAFVEQSQFNGRWCVYEPCSRNGKRLLERVKTLPYTASIDAALTLASGEGVKRAGGADAILRWAIDMMRAAGATIADLPRFICIAALRAKGDA